MTNQFYETVKPGRNLPAHTVREMERAWNCAVSCAYVASNLKGFNWYLHRSVDGCLVVILDSPIGKTAATVWIKPTCDGRYTWHTWDRHGIGGENDVSPSIPVAMKEAEMAVERQGKHAASDDDRWTTKGRR